MSGFTNRHASDMWSQPNNEQTFYESDYTQFQNQPLGFSPMPEYYAEQPGPYSPVFESVPFAGKDDDVDELPLLEELEIYPDRIFQKVLAVLNPFRTQGPTDDADYLTKDPDLAGPIAFYLVLAVCLFLSGTKAHFGYIYGISVVSCLMMYCLLNLMTANSGIFNLTTVASILGYSLIPIVGLSVLGVFWSLRGPIGITLAALAVLWSSTSASKLFVAISGDKEQQPLTAYPCALVSGVYVLLVVF